MQDVDVNEIESFISSLTIVEFQLLTATGFDPDEDDAMGSLPILAVAAAKRLGHTITEEDAHSLSTGHIFELFRRAARSAKPKNKRISALLAELEADYPGE